MITHGVEGLVNGGDADEIERGSLQEYYALVARIDEL
jgi:hypothetical protein